MPQIHYKVNGPRIKTIVQYTIDLLANSVQCHTFRDMNFIGWLDFVSFLSAVKLLYHTYVLMLLYKIHIVLVDNIVPFFVTLIVYYFHYLNYTKIMRSEEFMCILTSITFFI
jgi:hypothetical protein